MISYTIVKEANPPALSGTASGVTNFINLTFTALIGPLFGWLLHSASRGASPELEHYQSTFLPLLLGVGLALILTLALKETGRSAQAPLEYPEAA
jgi:hypothetical protein